MAKPIKQKLNTQTSVVDYLKSQGQDSSFDARKKLASDYGIKNYTGSESQNISLRNQLADSKPKEVALADTGGGKTPKEEAKKPETLFDSEVPATFTPTTQVVAGAGVSQDVWNSMNTPFSASSAYVEAMNYTNGLLQQLSSGRTSYTDQIKELMAQIQGREDFSYDVSQDTLFQQSLASAMASGKTAMQDTIGQASALTGGYGSTYATSAGNQAYNGYIQDAYANLPEYYQMAMEAYQMEGQEMYDQLAMLNSADATEYGRMYDSWNANFSNAQNMYSQEYGAWQDSVNNAYNMGNLQLNEQGQLFDQSSTLYAQEFNKWQAEADNAYRGATLTQDQTQFDASLLQDQTQFDTSMAQDQAQFEASLGAKGGGSTKVDENGEELATLTNSEISEIKKIYAEAGGGDGGLDAVDRYLTAIGKNNVDNENLMGMLNGIAIEVPVWEQDWTLSNDTFNWLWGDDNNDEYTNGDATMTFKELEEALEESGMSEPDKKKFLDRLRGQQK